MALTGFELVEGLFNGHVECFSVSGTLESQAKFLASKMPMSESRRHLIVLKIPFQDTIQANL